MNGFLADAYRRDLKKTKPLPAAEQFRLGRLYKKGDVAAGHKLVESCLPFVPWVAKRYVNYPVPYEDLIAAGNEGLMWALQRNDPERGVKFTSYAVWWIRAKMSVLCIDHFSLVRIGKTQPERRMFFTLGATIARLEQDAEGPVSDEDIAAALRMKVKDVAMMRSRMASTHKPKDIDDPIWERKLDDDKPDPEEQYGDVEAKQQVRRRVREALRRLQDRDRRLILMRYMSEEPMTLQQLGDELGISRERARQLELRAMNQLRKVLGRLDDVTS